MKGKKRKGSIVNYQSFAITTRSTVTAKRQAVASPENQRAATDPNNDLDLALNLDLDLDCDLDSPTATAFSETAAPAAALGTI